MTIGILSSIHSSVVPEFVTGLSRELAYDPRVPYVMSYFGKEQKVNIRNIGMNIVYLSRGWKPSRRKNIREYLPLDKTTLTIWLFRESYKNFEPALQVFEKNVPQVTLDFKTFTKESEYFQALNNVLRGTGSPDVILISNGWWPNFKRHILSIPEELFSVEECYDFFFSYSCSAFREEDKILAVPLFTESLVMIVNQAMLRDDRITLGDRPATSWPGLLQNGERLPKYFSKESIFTAIKPSTENHVVSRLFITLLLQGMDKEEVSKESILEILDFVKKIDQLAYIGKKSSSINRFHEKQPYDRFIKGEIAVLFGTESLYHQILRRFLSSDKIGLNESEIGIFPLPKIQEKDEEISVSQTWALAVPKKAQHQRQALAFLTYMAEEDSVQLFSKSTGRTPARITLAEHGVFRDIALHAKNPPGNTGTFDFEQKFPENFTALLIGEKSPEEVADFILSYFPDYETPAEKSKDEEVTQGGENIERTP